MKIRLTLESIVLLLFCSDIDEMHSRSVSYEEWQRIEKMLRLNHYDSPVVLLHMSDDEMAKSLLLDEVIISKISERKNCIPSLLKALDRFEHNRINITTKYEENYPTVLLKRLRKRAPLILYYYGNMENNYDGISLRGVSILTKNTINTIKKILFKLKEENLTYISNDAKGTDHYALTYALKNNIHCICIVSDHLSDKYDEYRKYINSGRMVLFSCENPDGYFDITKSLDCNIYVCGLSRYQVIVSTPINSGSTWFTALQNIHNHWIDSLVVENKYLGNQRLLDMGEVPLREEDINGNLTFEEIFNNNRIIIEKEKTDVDQMSIYEFLDEQI